MNILLLFLLFFSPLSIIYAENNKPFIDEKKSQLEVFKKYYPKEFNDIKNEDISKIVKKTQSDKKDTTEYTTKYTTNVTEFDIQNYCQDTESLFNSFLGSFQGKDSKINLCQRYKKMNNPNLRQLALHRAVCNKDVKSIKVLLEAGADVNVRDNSGRNSLHLAVCNKDVKSIKGLLEGGADVNVRDNSGRSSLHLAVCNDDVESIKVLLEAGADVDALNNDGETTLMLAARCNHVNVLKWLILYRPDINKLSNNGNTALMMADRCGHTECSKLLREQNN